MIFHIHHNIYTEIPKKYGSCLIIYMDTNMSYTYVHVLWLSETQFITEKYEYDYHSYCNEFCQNWKHSFSVAICEQIWDN